jgi:hypothetical protein
MRPPVYLQPLTVPLAELRRTTVLGCILPTRPPAEYAVEVTVADEVESSTTVFGYMSPTKPPASV